MGKKVFPVLNNLIQESLRFKSSADVHSSQEMKRRKQRSIHRVLKTARERREKGIIIVLCLFFLRAKVS